MKITKKHAVTLFAFAKAHQDWAKAFMELSEITPESVEQFLTDQTPEMQACIMNSREMQEALPSPRHPRHCKETYRTSDKCLDEIRKL